MATKPPDEKNYITPEGYAVLKAEFDQLYKVERPGVVKDVAWAASNGDRSENADYIYGKRRLRQIDARLKFLMKRMDLAEVVDAARQQDLEKIYFGAWVTLYAVNRDEEITYRIVAPAAWQARVEAADWTQIAGEPWIMTPPISTHHQLASTLFREHGIEPTKVVEADDEFVVSSLVMSGVGMALMREDLALEKVRTGEICLWKDVRLSTTLQFIHSREREGDPAIRALLAMLTEVWNLRRPRKTALMRARSEQHSILPQS